MKTVPHILVTDDDRRLRTLLRTYLTKQGYRVTEAADAAEARELLTLFTFDLMILDVMMPGETGLELARNLPTRTIDPPPILMLTARNEADDRIAGLESGVEDYLTKPFDPRELILRIANILKRGQSRGSVAVEFGAYRYLPESRQLYKNEEAIYLTTTEADLLSTLAASFNHPVSRDQLAASLKDDTAAKEATSRKVDVQIGRLRKKLEPDSPHPRYIQTVRGAGYKLTP